MRIFLAPKTYLVIVIVCFIFFSHTTSIKALTSSEIDKLLTSQQKVLEETSSSIENIHSEINNLQAGFSTTNSEIEKFEKNILDLEQTISKSVAIAESLSLEINTKTNEILETQEDIKSSIQAVNFRISKLQNNFYFSSKLANNSSIKYLKKLIEIQNKKLSTTIAERISITLKKQEADIQNTKLVEQKISLASIKENLTNQKNNYLAKISEKENIKKNLSQKVLSIQSTISELSEEQKKALQREQEILQALAKEAAEKNNAKPAPPSSFIKGEFTISGRGRDLYDGHAIGMSQWGAYGAAEKGMDYKTILSKYYTDITIGKGFENSTIVVKGYGKMDIETYLSGIGEVPDFACETEENKGKKYVKKDDPATDWDCWPEEAIKAQIVAARSYALGSIAGNTEKSVESDASFQVYDGGKEKQWVADATRGEVVLYNGQIATTYYTASLRGHSENNEFYWSVRSFSTKSLDALKGVPIGYLRGIDDSAWAYKNKYYDYKWKTNSFSLSKLTEILLPATGDIGEIKSIRTSKGASQRVWGLTLQGSKSTVYLAGWKFKSMINDYLYDFTKDRNFVFSTEFNIEEVN